MKEKRKNLSKEDIVKQQKQIEETKRLNQFTKEVFYPTLLKNQKNVEDAQLLCSVLEMAIQQAFINVQNTTTISQLDLGTIDEKYKEFKEVLSIFNDQTVKDTIYHLSSMKTAINTAVINEMRDRQLESLKTLDRLSKEE